jgi:hypothetical protein
MPEKARRKSAGKIMQRLLAMQPCRVRIEAAGHLERVLEFFANV